MCLANDRSGPIGLITAYRERSDRYVATWRSRMGEDAARHIFQFRVLALSACALVVGLQTAAIAAMVAQAFAAADVMYCALLLVALPLLFYSIRPLHKGMTIIRKRYGLPFQTRTRWRWSTLARTEAFDQWILESKSANENRLW